MATSTHEPVIAALINAGRRSQHVPARDEERLLASIVAKSEDACSTLVESATVIAGCFMGCREDTTAALIASETRDVESLDWNFLHQLARMIDQDCASAFIPGEIISSLSTHPRGRLAMSVCATMHTDGATIRNAAVMRRSGTVLLLAYATDINGLLELVKSGYKAIAGAALRRLLKIADKVELLTWVAEHKAEDTTVWKQVVDSMSDEEFYLALTHIPNTWPLTHMVLKIHREGPVGR